MKTVVVTGGIATGKSSFIKAFRLVQPEFGFIDCDQEVHQLLTTSDIVKKVACFFGSELIQSDGSLNRSLLRATLFNDEQNRHWLESILHPIIAERYLERRKAYFERCPAGLFVADVPLYFESEEAFECDQVLVVATTSQTQLRRLMTRNAYDEATAMQIIRAQQPIEEKVILADVLVWNEGEHDLLSHQASIFARTIPQAYEKRRKV